MTFAAIETNKDMGTNMLQANATSVLGRIQKSEPITDHTRTVSFDGGSVHAQFFQNQKFCSTLKHYLHKIYNVQSQIQNQQIQVSGAQQYVQAACEEVKDLFEALQSKVYNNPKGDVLSRSVN
jgi:hypothetical protein